MLDIFSCLRFNIGMSNSNLRIRASDASHIPKRGIHRHDHYEILIIKSGSGLHMVDFEYFDVKPNQVYFLRPGQTHQFLPKDAEFFFVAFDQADMISPFALRQFEFFQSFYCSGPVELDEIDSIIKHVVDIQYELNHPGAMQSILISGLVTVLLIKIQRKFRQFADNNVQKSSDLVAQFNQMIDDPSCCFRFVKDYASKLHISATYLNDTIRQSTGKAASYWINKKQINVSKQLLLNQDIHLKAIATQLGFSNATHFSRFFKSHTQQTPTQYRIKLLAQ